MIRAVNRQFGDQVNGAVEAMLEARDQLKEVRAGRGHVSLASAEDEAKHAEALVKLLAKGDVKCPVLDWGAGRVRVDGELRELEKPLGSVNVEVVDTSNLAQSVVTVRCRDRTYRLVGWRVDGLKVGKRLAVSGVAFAHYSDEFKMTELVKASVFDKDEAYVKAREDRAAAFKAARKGIENTHRNASNAPVSR